MKIRVAFVAFLAVIFLTALPASHAAVGKIHAPAHAMFGKGLKTVKFNLRNETGTPLELKVGDKLATLQEGQVMGFKLPVGTRIITNTATESHPAGALIVEVSSNIYSDSTITIKK